MDEMDFDFRDQIQNTDWYPLEIHHKNGALFLVDKSTALEQVAQAVAKDDIEQVKKWLDSNTLMRATNEQVELWRQDPYKIIGRFIIVAPYVFLQLG